MGGIGMGREGEKQSKSDSEMRNEKTLQVDNKFVSYIFIIHYWKIGFIFCC